MTRVPRDMPEYNSIRAQQVAESLANDIKFRLKLQQFDRFRMLVIVNVAEKQKQTVAWKMGFLWDVESDQWTSFQYETNSYVLKVVVFGVYWN